MDRTVGAFLENFKLKRCKMENNVFKIHYNIPGAREIQKPFVKNQSRKTFYTAFLE